MGNIRPQHPGARNVRDQYNGRPSRPAGPGESYSLPRAAAFSACCITAGLASAVVSRTCQLQESPLAQPVNSA